MKKHKLSSMINDASQFTGKTVRINTPSILYLITKNNMSNIQEKIEQEREQARAVCGIEGANTAECAAAWDAVEELQAEAAHQRDKIPQKNSLERYCDENPDAAECRLYDE